MMVLCGVDMVNSEYFFEDRVGYYNLQGRPVPQHESDQKDGEHKTNNPKFGDFTLEKMIRSMNCVVFDRKGFDLHV